MLTSAGQAGDARKSREYGIAAYLSKPVSQTDLIDAITAVLSAPLNKPQERKLITRHSLRESRKSLSILLVEDNVVTTPGRPRS
jgi:two-component system, sensor histidine kinase and response regulator